MTRSGRNITLTPQNKPIKGRIRHYILFHYKKRPKDIVNAQRESLASSSPMLFPSFWRSRYLLILWTSWAF
ncbi:MAG: hypothetical protein F6K62_21605 [Sphaerospermopsis sp. SIO1G2]|nr:hypothetical protein [Sphaerospermopsis sp. SIO1G2]